MNRPLTLPAREALTSTFLRWWNTQGEWVEAPNQRRDGESGVQRLQLSDPSLPALYCKRQVGHLYRSLQHPFGRPTVLRERQALSALTRIGIRVRELVYCGARREAGKWQALLITEELQGFVSLQDWYRGKLYEQWGTLIHRQLLQNLGITLSRLHHAHWQHGCCYPKHVFIKVHGKVDSAWVEIALLDLEKSRRRLRRSAASRHDLRQLYRHCQDMPECDWNQLRVAYYASFANPGGVYRDAI